MTTTELAVGGPSEEAITKLLQMDVNDLSLTDRQRYLWYLAVRKGLDPLTKPFDVIPDGRGKIIVYANASCTDQIREREKISLVPSDHGFLAGHDDVYLVHITAVTPEGRTATDVGAVGTKGFTGDALANAIMRAWTKAGRRATLDLSGLGVPDVSELDTVGLNKAAVLNGPRRLTPDQQVQPVVEPVEAQLVEAAPAPEPVSKPVKRYPPAVPPMRLKPQT